MQHAEPPQFEISCKRKLSKGCTKKIWNSFSSEVLLYFFSLSVRSLFILSIVYVVTIFVESFWNTVQCNNETQMEHQRNIFYHIWFQFLLNLFEYCNQNDVFLYFDLVIITTIETETTMKTILSFKVKKKQEKAEHKCKAILLLSSLASTYCKLRI